jgi:hypothetical protein
MQHDLKSDSDVAALSTELATFAPIAKSINIRTADDYTKAGEYLKRCKGAINQIESARVRITKPINESLREVNSQARESAQPWQQAESLIKNAMIVYQTEQERLQREEQRKRDEIARKEREKLEAQAKKLEAAGKTEKAAQVEARAASVVAPVITREIPKISGQSTREVWLFEIEDAGKVPREYMAVDEAKIRKVVNALKGETVIAGVRVYSEKRMASQAG